MFGGSNNNDTWIWNGSDWVSASPSSNLPSARSYLNLAYDPQHDDMVLFGGLGSMALGDTWTLGLVHTENWTLLNLATNAGPSARSFAAGVYDNGAFVFGGTNGSTALADTWVWFGNEWVTFVGSPSPPGRSMAAIAYDASVQNAVMFGGNSSPTSDIPPTGDTPLGDTWTNTSGTWANTGVSGPLAREGAAMVYDVLHTNTVLFGGYAGGTSFRDTWIWNGSAWNQQSPANFPSARYLHSMVFDSTRNQVLMFGGVNGSGVYMNDTWTWDGTNWTQRTPPNRPSARCAFAMVYDAVHGRVVLSGGLGGGGALNDTWVWDGVNWTELTPATSPTIRYGAAAAFVSSPIAQFLLFGGNNGTSNLNDTWVWASPYLASAKLPEAVSNQPYSYTLAPFGSVPPYKFHADGVPFSFSNVGLTLGQSTGAITGTMNAVPGQTIPFGVTIQDAQGQQTDLVVTITTVSSPIALACPAGTAQVGVAYSSALVATGGAPPYTFSISNGTLPPGLSPNSSTGATTGTPTTAGAYTFTAKVVDSTGTASGTTTANCSLTVKQAPKITSGNYTTFIQGIANSFTVTTSGYPAPSLSYSPILSLPAGVTFVSNSNGTATLSGKPTVSGVFPFWITANNGVGSPTLQSFTLTVKH